MPRLALIAALGLLLANTPATAAPVPKALPFKSPDAKTIAAFRELGASFGAMYEGKTGRLEFVHFSEADPAPDIKDELPGFAFRKWPEAGLPDIAIPFGLELSMTAAEIPDGLGKTAATWKNLRALRLRLDDIADGDAGRVAQFAALPDAVAVHIQILGGSLSDDGLAKFKAMKGVAALTLLRTANVTDAGLAHLKDLSRLSAFCTAHTKLTAASFRHLPKLTHLDVPAATDATMKGLGRLTGLTTLLLWGDELSDDSLEELKPLENLRYLSLSARGASDAGVAALGHLRRLEWLSVGGERLTDDGLKPLAGLTHLRTLSVCSLKVGDAGMKSLAKLDRLESLSVFGCKVTDAGVAELAGLTRLRRLSLTGCRVTDGGLKSLAGMTQLRHLDLRSTSVTDDGLAALASLTELVEIRAGFSPVTGAGAKAFMAKRPGCKVEFSGRK